MSKLQIIDDVHGKISLSDSDFIASGGEGSVYQKGGLAYKIYHNPNSCIPESKIKELESLKDPRILGPRSIVRDLKSQNAIGFSMPFAKNTIAISRLFTKTFKNQIGFSESDAVDLVEQIQRGVSFVHSNNILIVDLNEFSILVDNKKYKNPYFIDVDSWQTPNHKATALMESVRDRKVKNQNFTEESDWFSWGIVVFQLYIGVHPYRGIHPRYKPKEWSARMDNNVSVFDKDAKIPASCRPFAVIPKRHLDWFKAVFEKGERSIPPLPGDIAPIPTQVALVVIKGTENFSALRVSKYKDPIVYTFSLGSENYVLTKNNLFMKSYGSCPARDFSENKKRFIFNSGIGNAYLATLEDENLTIQFANPILGKEEEVISTVKSVKDVFIRDGNLYTVVGNKLMENVFVSGKKVMHSTRLLGSVMPNSMKVFPGCLYQSLLGEPAFMIPYDNRKIFFNIIKELSGYRIIDAKSEDNVLVVLTEKKGKIARFIIVFNSKFSEYSVRKVDNVDLEPINFTKIPGKVGVLYSGNETIEVFIDNNHVKVIDNAPIDSEMKMFNSNGKIFFINDNEIYQMDMKK